MTLRSAAAAVLVALFVRQAAPAEPADAPIHVVLRTQRSVHAGRDLRFQDGVFHLRQGDEDTTFPQADVAQVAFLRETDWLGEDGQRRGPPDPVVRLAVGTAILSRVHARRRRPPRAGRLHRLAETNAFYLPDERPESIFPTLAPQVADPRLAAVLCAETAARCAESDALPAAAKLFENAADRLRAKNPSAAFVYALMAAAVAGPPGRGPGKPDLERRLAETYPAERHRLRQFAEVLRRMLQNRPGPRPFGPPRRPRRPGDSPASPRGPEAKTQR
jgi:hypothetical protein